MAFSTWPGSLALTEWQICLALLLVMAIFGATHLLSRLRRRTFDPANPAATDVERAEFFKVGRAINLLLAQGFGLGKISVMPGTFGSLLGVGWFLLMLNAGTAVGLLALLALSAFLAVDVCDHAERLLRLRDPGCIVLDEIVAVPLCFAAWLALYWSAMGTPPPASYFFAPGVWPWTLGIFVAFRFFDIVKPWPVRQSQSLPGGWGVVVDDLLAAVWVNIAFVLVNVWWSPIP